MLRHLLYISIAVLLFGIPNEFYGQDPIIVTSTDDFYAPGEFRYEIENANFGDTIIVDVTGSVVLTAPININANVVVIGPEPIHFRLDGNNIGAGPIFKTFGSFNVSMYGVTLMDASVNWFDMDGVEEIKLKNCYIRNNSESPLTSNIIAEGFYEIEACSFFYNTGTFNGGAISMEAGALKLVNSTFHENQLTSGGNWGGAIYYAGIHPVDIIGCTFYNNGTAPMVSGAAIRSTGGGAGIALQNNIFYNMPQDISIVVGGNFLSNGGNFINVNTPPFGTFMNVVGNGMDPMLQPATVDGFGLEYFPLQAGSPCIDIGNPANGAQYDQRRVWRDMRASGNAEIADAGAVEFSPYTVRNTNPSGPGSFEEAVNDIIGLGYDERKAIVFEIPGAGPHYTTATNTNSIIEPFLIINGYSQSESIIPGPEDNGGSLTPGYTPAVYQGSGATDFLDISAGADSVRIAGLCLNNYFVGIKTTAFATIIEGCHIGTDEDGIAAGPNSFGISAPSGAAGGVTIGVGEYLWSNPRQARNVVSANTAAQIELSDCGGNRVSGNFIGPSSDGMTIPSGASTGAKGIYLRAVAPSAIPPSKIGGYDYGDENVICGQDAGIHNELSNVEIAYNFIGTDYWGGAPASLPNFANVSGIVISGSNAYDNWVEGNIIVNTDNAGVNLTNNSSGTYVVENYFGLAEDGLTAIHNRGDGLLIDLDANSNIIGGIDTQDGNFISNSDGAGIAYRNMGAVSQDSVIGNYIGLDTSFLPAANATGIFIESGTFDVFIGDVQTGRGNEIAYNTTQGIETGVSVGGIRISGNSMYNNGSLGIDLDSDGPSITQGTAPSANNGQIPPHLDILGTCPGNPFSTIEFTVDFPISTTYQIEFFHGDSDGEEGADYIENTLVTPTTQPQTFVFDLSGPALGAGDYITATATELTNNHSSEFSDTILYNAATANAIDQNGEYCSDTPGGSSHTVDLITDFDALVNGGSGDPVSWYSDAACTSMLASPGSYPGFNTQIVYAVVDGGICTDTAQVTVVVNSSPDVSGFNPAFTDASCFGNCDGDASFTGPTGSGETYDFGEGTGPISSNFLSGICAGSYTITHVDMNGCIGTDLYTINEPTDVSVVETPTDAGCFGVCDGSLSAAPSGGTFPYTFSWDNGAGTSQFPGGICAGTYTVTVTDANGCVGVGVGAVVSEPSALSMTFTGVVDELCNGGVTGQATAAPAGGTPTYTYLWDATAGSQTTATATGLPAGTFSVTATDANGCFIADNVTVTEPTSLTVFDVVDNQISCFGVNDGQATVTPSGGTAPYTSYVWSPVPGGGQGTITATGLSVGSYNCTVTDNNGCSAISAAMVITQPTSLVVSVTQVDPSCNGMCDGQATATPSGGTFPYTFAWTPSIQSSATAVGLCAGNHTITVTDANGCVMGNGVTLTDPPAIVPDAGIDATICDGNSVTLNGNATGGTPPYTHTWDNGATDGVPVFPVITTTYNLTVTDAVGCVSSTDDNIVTVNPLPNVTAGTNISVCSNNADATLNGSVVNATGGIWTGGAGVFNPSSTDLNATYTPTAGEISGGSVALTLTTTGNGSCAAANDILNITYTPSPTINAGGSSTVCANNPDVNLAGSVTVATGANWTGGSGVFSPSSTTLNATYTPSGADIAAGNVALTITSTGNGNCFAVSDIMNININNAPTVDAGLDATICGVGATASLNASITVATGVTWSGGSGTFSDPNILNPIYTPSAGELLGGSVILTATTTGNGICLPEVSSMTLTINSPPLALTITGTNPICEGGTGSASVSNTGGSTYAWTTNGSSTILSGNGTNSISVDYPVAESVDISVIETDASGCVGPTSNIFTVTVNALPTVTGSTDATFCDGIFTTLTGGGASTYSWDNGVTDGVSFQPPLGVTTYTVTGTDVNGCQNTATTDLTVNANPSITVGFTDITCNGFNDGTITITTTSGTTPYQYSIDGGSVYQPGTDPYTYSGLSAATNSLYAQDANGCISNNVMQPITEPSAMSFTSLQTTDVTCAGNDGTVDVIGASGGLPTYNYSSDGGATYQAASLFASLSAGSYPMMLQDQNGCTLSLGTGTIANTPPLLISTNAFTNVTCNGLGDGTATSNAATGGSGTYTYQWYSTSTGAISGQTAISTSGLVAGDYYIEASDGSCIINSDTLTIIEPAPIVFNVTPSNPTCFGDTDGSILIDIVSGGTAPFTFSDDNGSSYSAGTSPFTFPENAGSYDMMVQDNNGCMTASQNVNIVDPTQLVLSLTVTNETCFGGADGSIDHLVSGGAGFPYDLNINGGGYSTMGTNPEALNGLTDGYSHSVVVMDLNGCTDSATAAITGPAQITFNTSLVDDTCSQGVGAIIVSNVAGGTGGPYGYSIDNGNTVLTSPVINVVSGTYNLLVGDVNGCFAIGSGLVINDVVGNLTSAGTNGPYTICPGESVYIQAYGGASYNWLTHGVEFPLLDSTEVSPDSTTKYVVEITSGGCMKVDSTMVIIDANGCAVGEISNNVFTPDGDNINDVFTLDIQYLLNNENTVSIYNRWGDLINSYNNYNNDDIAWDGNNAGGDPVPAGTYFFVVEVPGVNYSNSGWIQVVR